MSLFLLVVFRDPFWPAGPGLLAFRKLFMGLSGTRVRILRTNAAAAAVSGHCSDVAGASATGSSSALNGTPRCLGTTLIESVPLLPRRHKGGAVEARAPN